MSSKTSNDSPANSEINLHEAIDVVSQRQGRIIHLTKSEGQNRKIFSKSWEDDATMVKSHKQGLKWSGLDCDLGQQDMLGREPEDPPWPPGDRGPPREEDHEGEEGDHRVHL